MNISPKDKGSCFNRRVRSCSDNDMFEKQLDRIYLGPHLVGCEYLTSRLLFDFGHIQVATNESLFQVPPQKI